MADKTDDKTREQFEKWWEKYSPILDHTDNKNDYLSFYRLGWADGMVRASQIREEVKAELAGKKT